MAPNFETLVSSIYDCAANPDLWPDTCCKLRDALDAAFVVVGFMEVSEFGQGKAKWHRRNSPWDPYWLDALDDLIPSIPAGNRFYESSTDIAWTQLGSVSESEFQQTDFYRKWVEPQNLRDALNIKYLSRPSEQGILGASTRASRAPIGASEKKLAERLSPHIRRAVLINDLTEQMNLTSLLQKQVLDQLSAAVFVVGPGQRMTFTNTAGDQMLSQGEYLRLVGGSLQTRRNAGLATSLESAVAQALFGDSNIGTKGIGVPLLGDNDDRLAAYVLPLSGHDARGDFGPGHCAVFVSRRGKQQPMAVDILRMLFDLTPSECRVALMVAQGDGPKTISYTLGVTLNTVRTHLKHCFAKTGTPDQTGLSGTINKLLLPLK